MKETDISEELWFKFLEGRTNEEETERITRLMAEDDELMAEFMAMREAMQMTDAEPCKTPDFDLAKEQISQVLHKESTEENKVIMLPRRSNIRKYFAVAAVAALLIGVALFFLFRPDHSDNNLARQEQKKVGSVEKVQSQKSETAEGTQHNENSSKKNVENDQPASSDASSDSYTTQKIEKNYATTQEANSLTVTKPNKDNYRVLCKNLEKTLNFEWSATNVKTLHFTVKDSKGKTIAESKDVAANQFSLKYGEIHPEKKLTWSLVVVFKDGSQEKRGGQIQIDYNN